MLVPAAYTFASSPYSISKNFLLFLYLSFQSPIDVDFGPSFQHLSNTSTQWCTTCILAFPPAGKGIDGDGGSDSDGGGRRGGQGAASRSSY